MDTCTWKQNVHSVSEQKKKQQPTNPGFKKVYISDAQNLTDPILFHQFLILLQFT